MGINGLTALKRITIKVKLDFVHVYVKNDDDY